MAKYLDRAGLDALWLKIKNTFAPKNHASSSTTYGVGTESNYGHVKLTDDIDESDSHGVSSGIATTPKAVADAILEAILDADAATRAYTTIEGDSGTAQASTNNDTITIAGGTGITTAATNTNNDAVLTINLDTASVTVNTTNHTYSFTDTNGAVTGTLLENITNDLDSRIDNLENTIASTFTYEVKSDASILSSTPTAANMYIIYFVPIANADADDSDESTDDSHNGNHQLYAEYIAVNKGSSASPQYVWERLGTTDVNIDSIPVTYIQNLSLS